LSNGSHLCKTKTGESWSFTLVTLRGKKKNGKEKKRNGKIGKQCHGIIIVFGANFFPWYCHTINYLI
jgi:hypothetical protein